jgi:hypothetical protein
MVLNFDKMIWRLFGYMLYVSWFHSQGYGLAAAMLFGNSPCIIGIPSLTGFCWVLFGAWLLG